MERKNSSEEIIKEAINHCESWPPMVGGGPWSIQLSTPCLYWPVQERFLHIYSFSNFQQKTRGIEIQGVTKYKYKKGCDKTLII